MSSPRTFLITGVSSGLGRAIAEGAMRAGHTVVGTVRREADARAFAARSDRAIARMLDVADEEAVFATVGEVLGTVGPIDVLVANAGYGQEGTLEESPMQELRDQFAVNVFGAVATIKAVLPSMRERRSGHVIGITSMGGLRTFPGLSFYHGSKYAMEGILESLAREVAHVGVHVTAVAPGGFRTDWAGRSMVRTRNTIADYDDVVGPLSANREANSGKQLGDPVRAAQAVLAIVEASAPPRHLLLGSDALRLVAQGRAELQRDIDAWEELSRSTDIEGAYQIAS